MEIDTLFKFHMLNKIGQQRAKEISLEFQALLTRLEGNCPVSREWSIVRTKLEEACFYAKKSMANSPDNQESNP